MKTFRTSALFALALLAACAEQVDPTTADDAPAAAAPVATAPVAAAEPAAPAGPVLKAADVEALVRAAIESLETRDVDAFAALISDDFTMTLGGAKFLSYEGETFDRAAVLDEGNSTNTTFMGRFLSATVAEDGQSATAQAGVTSSTSFHGTPVVETDKYLYVVEFRDGVPKIVSITTTVTGLTINGVKVDPNSEFKRQN